MDETETPADAPEIVPETPPAVSRRSLSGAIGVGVAVALVCALIGLRTLAIATLPSILAPGDDIDFQEALPGLPIPRLLDWNLSQIELLLNLRQIEGVSLALASLALCGALWLLAVCVLNPSFRLFRIARAPAQEGETSSVLTVGLETPRLMKALSLLVPLALLGGLFLRLGMGERAGVLSALWLMALGIVLWIGFRPDGLAGDFARRRWSVPGHALPRLVLRGAAFGLGLFFLLHRVWPGSLEGVLRCYATLGTFHRGYWAEIAWAYLLGAGLCGFAIGTLFYLLARPGAFSRRSLVLAALPFVTAGLALAAQRPLAVTPLEARIDLTGDVLAALPEHFSPRNPVAGVPDGAQAERELSRRAALNPSGKLTTLQTERSILLFHPRGLINARQSMVSEDGLPFDAQTAEKIQNFLRKRDYRTALSWVAFKRLFDTGVTQFDPTAALQACLLDQTHCPHLGQISGPMRALLFVSAATPENIAIADALADDRRFAYPDRASLRMMGDLFNRVGEAAKAERWYRRAEMPKSFYRIIHQYPVFHAGRVTGQLRLNGRPLAGARVGLVPKRMNGLPRDLQAILLDADREVIGNSRRGLRFSRAAQPFHPRPFAFRWVCEGATTDAQGRFTLDHLLDGEYYLLVALPPDILLNPPLDSALRVRNAPRPLILSAAAPALDLPAIEIFYARRNP